MLYLYSTKTNKMTTQQVVEVLIQEQTGDYEIVIKDREIVVYPTFVQGKYAQHFESISFLQALVGRVQIMNGFDSEADSVYFKFIAQ